MRHTKAQVLDQFRYLWKVATIENPSLKTDTIAKRESWNDYTDMLCKEGDITMNQYNNWSNPFWCLHHFLRKDPNPIFSQFTWSLSSWLLSASWSTIATTLGFLSLINSTMLLRWSALMHNLTSATDENNSSNLSDSSYNRRGTFIFLKRYAHQTKDTQGDQITE